jgi:hypothetical protein
MAISVIGVPPPNMVIYRNSISHPELILLRPNTSAGRKINLETYIFPVRNIAFIWTEFRGNLGRASIYRINKSAMGCRMNRTKAELITMFKILFLVF